MLLIFVNSCSIFASEQYQNGITISNAIFTDNTIKEVYLVVDSVIPNLTNSIQDEIKNVNLKLVDEKYDNRNLVVLKVKTIFDGRASQNQIKKLTNEDSSTKTREKNTIDHLIEDPSGMIIGFAIGTGMSNPITAAPLGMAIGASSNLMIKNFKSNNHFTILEIEVLEKVAKPIWYKDVRTHKIDETSTRTFEYSEETTWKTHKTRIFVRGKYSNNEISKRIVSLII